jgi:hypothetical protein
VSNADTRAVAEIMNPKKISDPSKVLKTNTLNPIDSAESIRERISSYLIKAPQVDGLDTSDIVPKLFGRSKNKEFSEVYKGKGDILLYNIEQTIGELDTIFQHKDQFNPEYMHDMIQETIGKHFYELPADYGMSDKPPFFKDLKRYDAYTIPGTNHTIDRAAIIRERMAKEGYTNTGDFLEGISPNEALEVAQKKAPKSKATKTISNKSTKEVANAFAKKNAQGVAEKAAKETTETIVKQTAEEVMQNTGNAWRKAAALGIGTIALGIGLYSMFSDDSNPKQQQY